jgi:hypothetical protein
MLDLYYGVFTGKKFTIEETKRVGLLYFIIGLVLGAIGIILAITTLNKWETIIPILLSYFHIIIGALFLAKA